VLTYALIERVLGAVDGTVPSVTGMATSNASNSNSSSGAVVRGSLPRAASLLDVAFNAQLSKRAGDERVTPADGSTLADARRRFVVCRNTLIYFAFVDKLHKLLKVSDDTNVAGERACACALGV
jgi:hypothetical protein